MILKAYRKLLSKKLLLRFVTVYKHNSLKINHFENKCLKTCWMHTENNFHLSSSLQYFSATHRQIFPFVYVYLTLIFHKTPTLLFLLHCHFPGQPTLITWNVSSITYGKHHKENTSTKHCYIKTIRSRFLFCLFGKVDDTSLKRYLSKFLCEYFGLVFITHFLFSARKIWM